jgi:hypothetical protein
VEMALFLQWEKQLHSDSRAILALLFSFLVASNGDGSIRCKFSGQN